MAITKEQKEYIAKSLDDLFEKRIGNPIKILGDVQKNIQDIYDKYAKQMYIHNICLKDTDKIYIPDSDMWAFATISSGNVCIKIGDKHRACSYEGIGCFNFYSLTSYIFPTGYDNGLNLVDKICEAQFERLVQLKKFLENKSISFLNAVAMSLRTMHDKIHEVACICDRLTYKKEQELLREFGILDDSKNK